MRILFCRRNTINHVPNQLHLFAKSLAQKTDVAFYGPGYPGYDTKNIVKVVERVKPDVVLIDDQSRPAQPEFTDVEEVDVPKVLFRVEDVHARPQQRIRFINRRKFDLITSPLITEIDSWRPRMNAPVLFMPHSVDLDFFKPRYKDRDHDVIFRGAYDPHVYPLRCRIVQFLESIKDINHGWKPRPPGGYDFADAQKEMKEYSHALANSKIFMFGVGRYRKALAKFWEGGACKTMVMADEPYDLEAHHLVPGENFVVINGDNFEEKLRYYLEDEAESLRIVENMYQTTVKHHDTEKVVEGFIKVLESI